MDESHVLLYCLAAILLLIAEICLQSFFFLSQRQIKVYFIVASTVNCCQPNIVMGVKTVAHANQTHSVICCSATVTGGNDYHLSSLSFCCTNSTSMPYLCMLYFLICNHDTSTEQLNFVYDSWNCKLVAAYIMWSSMQGAHNQFQQ
jgi:hypothetical protein